MHRKKNLSFVIFSLSLFFLHFLHDNSLLSSQKNFQDELVWPSETLHRQKKKAMRIPAFYFISPTWAFACYLPLFQCLTSWAGWEKVSPKGHWSYLAQCENDSLSCYCNNGLSGHSPCSGTACASKCTIVLRHSPGRLFPEHAPVFTRLVMSIWVHLCPLH